MEKQTILLISDMRQVYLAEILTKRGNHVRCLDIRNQSAIKEQLVKLKVFLNEADVLVLPIPVTKGIDKDDLNEILNKNVKNETIVMGGCFLPEQQRILTERGIRYLDFMEDKVVTEENAIATAEGAIAELIRNCPYNIEGSKIIVTGYGYCGKAIAKKLGALGARVTVLARRSEVRKLAKQDGFYAADFAFGPEEAMGAVMLVNTVPAPVVTKLMIRELPRDAYILDIASNPGGTDFSCAKESGISADLVLGIPGRFSPKASAYILARAMERFTLVDSNGRT
ncbi:MAG: dipicolinate synthase [Roseburia sp.]|nr:dipicolinate synthase [Roseburia sp.]